MLTKKMFAETGKQKNKSRHVLGTGLKKLDVVSELAKNQLQNFSLCKDF